MLRISWRARHCGIAATKGSTDSSKRAEVNMHVSDSTTLEDFQRGKVDDLKAFCKCRGLPTKAKRKVELVALVYAANMWVDINEYLLEKGRGSLMKRIRNDYMEDESENMSLGKKKVHFAGDSKENMWLEHKVGIRAEEHVLFKKLQAVHVGESEFLLKCRPMLGIR